VFVWLLDILIPWKPIRDNPKIVLKEKKKKFFKSEKTVKITLVLEIILE